MNQETISTEIANKILNSLHKYSVNILRREDIISATTFELCEIKNFSEAECEYILEALFPKEVNDIKKSMKNTCNELIELFKNATRTLILFIENSFEEATQTSYPQPELTQELCLHFPTKASSKIADFHQKIVEIVNRRQTFLSGVALLLQLNQRNPDECKIEVESGDIPIIRVWSKLADVGFGLAPPVLEKISQISKLYSKLGQKLVIHSKEISNFLGGCEVSKLSSLVYDQLSQSNDLADLKEYIKYLVDYVVQHLRRLNEERRPLPKDIEDYINKVFVNRGFAEFEVYSAFIRLGIPAIPRLKVPYKDEKKGTKYEVDVLAAPRNELWVVEVKTGESLEEEELENLNIVKQILNANRVVLVVDKPKEAEELVNKIGYKESMHCLSFSDLIAGCGFFQEYLRALTTSTQSAKNHHIDVKPLG
ncbi:hypothetical protein [Infirmifilum sp. NZ]|uniref:hypothetical protein n=1 Tax=Infirmifilum sp. NZ TaxID=2926850 RepID=UPI0027A4A9D4|nr:hypothetical protein [Infirmifilum sp. NZ]UNQ73762.1 hypothetical protein MOV14_01805 [Infirmifilum sp. NZ]